jgi:hypothetical protein
MQKGASFNLEAVKEQVQKAMQSHAGKQEAARAPEVGGVTSGSLAHIANSSRNARRSTMRLTVRGPPRQPAFDC